MAGKNLVSKIDIFLCLLFMLSPSLPRTDQPPRRRPPVKSGRTVRNLEAVATGPTIRRLLRRGKNSEHVNGSAPVYLAAVMEYLAAEVLELAGDAARDSHKNSIAPRDLQLAFRIDEELNQLRAALQVRRSAGETNGSSKKKAKKEKASADGVPPSAEDQTAKP